MVAIQFGMSWFERWGGGSVCWCNLPRRSERITCVNSTYFIHLVSPGIRSLDGFCLLCLGGCPHWAVGNKRLLCLCVGLMPHHVLCWGACTWPKDATPATSARHSKQQIQLLHFPGLSGTSGLSTTLRVFRNFSWEGKRTLDGTNRFLWNSTVSCIILQKSAVSCGFLQKSAPPKCCNFKEEARINTNRPKKSENLRNCLFFLHALRNKLGMQIFPLLLIIRYLSGSSALLLHHICRATDYACNSSITATYSARDVARHLLHKSGCHSLYTHGRLSCRNVKIFCVVHGPWHRGAFWSGSPSESQPQLLV